MRKIVNVPFRYIMSASPALLFLALACTPQEQTKVNAAVNDGLTIAQDICVMASELTDVAAVALACGIIKQGEVVAPQVEAFIDSQINARESLKRSGYAFDKTSARWTPKPGAVAPCEPKK